MTQLRLIFLNHNYPSKIIDKEFKRLLKYQYSLNIDKIFENDTKAKYKSLPYKNDRSEIKASKFKRLVKEYYCKIK